MALSIQKDIITQWLPSTKDSQTGIRITLNSQEIKVEKISRAIFPKQDQNSPILPVTLESKNFTWKDLKLQNLDHRILIEKVKDSLQLVKETDHLVQVVNKIKKIILLEQAAKPHSFNRWLLAGISIGIVASTALAYYKCFQTIQHPLPGNPLDRPGVLSNETAIPLPDAVPTPSLYLQCSAKILESQSPLDIPCVFSKKTAIPIPDAVPISSLYPQGSTTISESQCPLDIQFIFSNNTAIPANVNSLLSTAIPIPDAVQTPSLYPQGSATISKSQSPLDIHCIFSNETTIPVALQQEPPMITHDCIGKLPPNAVVLKNGKLDDIWKIRFKDEDPSTFEGSVSKVSCENIDNLSLLYGKLVRKDETHTGSFVYRYKQGIGTNVKNGVEEKGFWFLNQKIAEVIEDRGNNQVTLRYLDDESIYEGEVKAWGPDGHGRKTFKDKRIYDGSFQFCKEHGLGTLTIPPTFSNLFGFLETTSKGIWEDGKQINTIIPKDNGEFELQYLGDHSIYTGPVNKAYRPHGQGQKEFADKAVYIGNFVNGFEDGLGKITYANGSQWEGNWKRGIKVEKTNDL